MKLRLSHILLGALASLVLVTGCRVSHRGSGAAGAAEPESVMERRAQAHAYYAQGVVDEMDKRTDEAQESYHKAAVLDPGNEELVADRKSVV